MLEVINVLVAAVASFAVGAAYYMKLSKPWMDASGVERGDDGQPANAANPMLYVSTFLLQLIVAGMMRHVFELANIDTLGKGLVAGLGIGLFFISPWIGINNAYVGRPIKLTLIDGGYATIACAVMGLVLTLF
ncbi:MAG: DUF1761 domain-containing protein [Pelagimonas sp.]|uniref:DUF1761 domain-containing protein n=1 Tax=Pelagimonas sp. TaxID=2073170 RepID=UPI003D6A2620